MIRLLLGNLPVKVVFRRRRPDWPSIRDRLSYQQPYLTFHRGPNEQVLDIGSGSHPFPDATVQVERSVERHQALPGASPLQVTADIHDLPFRNKCFDFVYCSHVLEHVDDPLQACEEIMRVGKRGFVETPLISTDMLFAWARDMHKWYVVNIAQILCFFEYSQRQLDGIGSPAWRSLILGKWYHPLQAAFWENQDLFNVMFSWVDQFAIFVFRLDGTVKTLNVERQDSDEIPCGRERAGTVG